MYDIPYFKKNPLYKLKLFTNCFLVSGSKYTTINDIQRNNYLRFPSFYANVIISLSQKPIFEYLEECSSVDEQEEVLGLITFLVENEVAWVDGDEMFEMLPKIDTTYYPKSEIHNVIIEIAPNSPWFENHYTSLLEQIESMDCLFIDIHLYDTSNHLLKKIVEESNKFDFHSFTIKMNYHKDLSSAYLKSIFERNFKLTSIELFSVPSGVTLECGTIGHLKLREDKLISHKQCGVVSSDFFVVNDLLYFESLNHNTCLNQKITIDINGDIKNCPSMRKTFGNIQEVAIKDVLNDTTFKSLWNIKKEEITKCKDCEYRHVCTDCRAYLDNPEDLYSAPLKCGYNPYSGEWEEWKLNPLKQKAVNYYGLKDNLS